MSEIEQQTLFVDKEYNFIFKDNVFLVERSNMTVFLKYSDITLVNTSDEMTLAGKKDNIKSLILVCPRIKFQLNLIFETPKQKEHIYAMLRTKLNKNYDKREE